MFSSPLSRRRPFSIAAITVALREALFAANLTRSTVVELSRGGGGQISRGGDNAEDNDPPPGAREGNGSTGGRTHRAVRGGTANRGNAHQLGRVAGKLPASGGSTCPGAGTSVRGGSCFESNSGDPLPNASGRWRGGGGDNRRDDGVTMTTTTTTTIARVGPPCGIAAAAVPAPGSAQGTGHTSPPRRCRR